MRWVLFGNEIDIDVSHPDMTYRQLTWVRGRVPAEMEIENAITIIPGETEKTVIIPIGQFLSQETCPNYPFENVEGSSRLEFEIPVEEIYEPIENDWPPRVITVFDGPTPSEYFDFCEPVVDDNGNPTGVAVVGFISKREGYVAIPVDSATVMAVCHDWWDRIRAYRV